MSEFNGTEGKWKVIEGKSSGKQVISESAPKTRMNVASCGGQRRDENANLIAAAPELLEACLRMRNQIYAAGYEAEAGSMNPTKCLLAQVEVAITKALGETNE